MALIETWFNQEMKEPVKVRYLDGNVFSADNAGNLIGVNLFSDGEPALLSGSVAANVVRADGATVAVSGALSGNKATVVLNQSCYAIPGPISIVIKITASGAVTTVCAVVANVYRSSTDAVVDPGTIIPSIETLIAEIEAAVASIPADYSSLWTSLAPAFSNSVAYSVGQYVTYDGGLYRFTTDHPAGTWNASHVTAVSIGSELYATNTTIKNDETFYGKLKRNLKIEAPVLVSYPGKAWNSSGTLVDSHSNTAFEFPAKYPNQYILTGLRISLDSEPILILDSSNNILASYLNYPDYATYQKYVYTLPNTAKIRYSTYTNATWDRPPVEVCIPDFIDNYDFNVNKAYVEDNTGMIQSITEADLVPVSFTVSNGDAYGYKGEKIIFGTQDYYRHTKITGVSPKEAYIVKIIRSSQRVISNYVVFVDSNDIVIGSTLGQDTSDNRTKNNLVVVPDGASAFYVVSFTNVDSRLEVYKVTQRYNSVEPLAGRNYSDIQKIAMADNCEGKFQQVKVTRTTGKTWNDSAAMIDDANGTAFEMPAKEYEKYRLTGLRTGIDRPVFFLDSNGAILERYLPGSQTANFYLDVIAPKNCTMIRYSSYTNPSWDGYNPTNEVAYAWIPDYYFENGYLDGKIDDIRDETKFVNGIAFAFFTDLHMNYNAKNSIYLLKEIFNKTSVPFVICGGDIPGAYGGENDLIETGNLISEWQAYLGEWRFFNIRGNHDFTIKTNSSMTSREPNTGVTLPAGYAFDYQMRKQERFLKCSSPDNMAWYIEIPDQKTRIVGVNSCDGQMTDTTASWGVDEIITQAQVDWLLSSVVDKTDYKYIFVSHVTSDPDMGIDHYGQDVIQALLVAMANHTVLNYSDSNVTASKDFSAYTCEVVCHISGHAHTDASHKEDNVLSIITTCDAYYQDDGHGAEKGTITEQAIDVFCIDFDQKTINAIRVGRGDDRSWTYGS